MARACSIDSRRIDVLSQRFFRVRPTVSDVFTPSLSATNAPEKSIAVLPIESLRLQTDVSDWNPNGAFLRLRLIDAAGTRRFFVSYRGRLIELYFGWRPSGSFGIALRKANAKPVTGPHVGNRQARESKETNTMSFWKALLYLGVPQSGYHPTWPDCLRFVGWWFRNPLPGLTEFWLGLKKRIEVYEQIGGQWFPRKALRRQNKSAQTLHLSRAMPNGTRPVENILHSASDRSQDRGPYEDLADMVRGPGTARQASNRSTGWVFETSGKPLSPQYPLFRLFMSSGSYTNLPSIV
jgi:hypothetical protein